MADNNAVIVWVFGAMATGSVAVAGYLWTEIVRLDRHLSVIDQTSQVQMAQIAECRNLEEILIKADAFAENRAREMFIARGCTKVKVK